VPLRQQGMRFSMSETARFKWCEGRTSAYQRIKNLNANREHKVHPDLLFNP